ncbi:hypothetical protein [Candidatus Magnetaquiglobus chichijimensis]|uniref:hypothetical protein n=1 Tax=Candidatus Magnetaquiglobus chichijimensis TaxID=3141448 RepID=UPI003B972E5A
MNGFYRQMGLDLAFGQFVAFLFCQQVIVEGQGADRVVLPDESAILPEIGLGCVGNDDIHVSRYCRISSRTCSGADLTGPVGWERDGAFGVWHGRVLEHDHGR